MQDIQRTSVNAASAADHALTYFTTLTRQLITWTVVGLTTAKFKALMLPEEATLK
jgi:hypothetical protein